MVSSLWNPTAEPQQCQDRLVMPYKLIVYNIARTLICRSIAMCIYTVFLNHTVSSYGKGSFLTLWDKLSSHVNKKLGKWQISYTVPLSPGYLICPISAISPFHRADIWCILPVVFGNNSLFLEINVTGTREVIMVDTNSIISLNFLSLTPTDNDCN